MLRDLKLEKSGNAPRILSMDDYFMTEVEKTEENDASKPLSRGKKPVTKTVIEFCYEPEMEEAYRSSMLKSLEKTLEEGVHAFVIVDDRNLRVADFARFWATAKRSGYEAYVLEAPYKDPAGCAARNVHGFTRDEVAKMAVQWEEAPPLYVQLDIKPLLHGDDWKEGNIEEVDMDMEEEDFDASLSNYDERQAEKTPLTGNLRPDASPKDERNSNAENAQPTEEVKDLGRSKWSDDLDDDGDEGTGLLKGKANVLSGLMRTYAKDGRFVHWGDQSSSDEDYCRDEDLKLSPSTYNKNLLNSKRGKEIESTKAELDEVIDENQRLKKCVNQIMEDYEVLQRKIGEILKQKSNNLMYNDKMAKDNDHENEREVVSLSLGGTSSANFNK